MIANISPSGMHREDTYNTLRYVHVYIHIPYIAGHFCCGFYFRYGEPQIETSTPQKCKTVGYYYDMLRAYNENKTTKISF